MISASAAETSRSAPEGGSRVAALDRAVVVAAVISTLSHAAQPDARSARSAGRSVQTTVLTIIVEAVCVFQFGRSDRERIHAGTSKMVAREPSVQTCASARAHGSRSADRQGAAEMRRIGREAAQLACECVGILGTTLVSRTVHLGRDAHQGPPYALLVDQADAVG